MADDAAVAGRPPAAADCPRWHPQLALAALAARAHHHETTLTVADVDWPRFAPAFAAARPRPLLHDLPDARRALEPRGASAARTMRLLAAGSATSLRPIGSPTCLRLVRTHTAAVLGHPDASRLDPQHGFLSTSASTRSWRSNSASGSARDRRDLPATLTFDHPSPHHVADFLRRSLSRPPSASLAVPDEAAPGRARSDDEPSPLSASALRLPGGVVDLAALWRLLSRASTRSAPSPPTAGTPTRSTTPTPTPGQELRPRGRFLDRVDLFDAALLRHQPARGEAHRPAATPPARDRLGGARARRHAPAAPRHADRRLRRHRRPATTRALPRRPRTRGPLPAPARAARRRRAARLHARAAGPGAHRRHRLLLLAGRAPPRLPGAAPRRVRRSRSPAACRSWPRPDAFVVLCRAARARARRPLQDLLGRAPTATAAARASACSLSSACATPRRTATRCSPSSAAAPSTTTARRSGITAPERHRAAEGASARPRRRRGSRPPTSTSSRRHGTGTSLGDPIEAQALARRRTARTRPERAPAARLRQDQHRPPRGRRRLAGVIKMVAGAAARARCPRPCTPTPAPAHRLGAGPSGCSTRAAALAAERPPAPRRRLRRSASAAPTPTSSSRRPPPSPRCRGRRPSAPHAGRCRRGLALRPGPRPRCGPGRAAARSPRRAPRRSRSPTSPARSPPRAPTSSAAPSSSRATATALLDALARARRGTDRAARRASAGPRAGRQGRLRLPGPGLAVGRDGAARCSRPRRSSASSSRPARAPSRPTSTGRCSPSSAASPAPRPSTASTSSSPPLRRDGLPRRPLALHGRRARRRRRPQPGRDRRRLRRRRPLPRRRRQGRRAAQPRPPALAGRGAMVAVELPAADVERRLAPFGGRLSIAAINSPRSTVVSGDADAVDALARAARQAARSSPARSRVDYASHCAHMEALRDDSSRLLADLAPRAPRIPLYSTVTGGAHRRRRARRRLLVPKPPPARPLRGRPSAPCSPTATASSSR